MAETKKKNKVQDKPQDQPKHGHRRPADDSASGIPSRGGSRQGNIGHESNEVSDNAHR